jgi:hypothetical protein
MGAYKIDVSGFDEVRWEARVGIAVKRNGVRRPPVVVRGNARAWRAWLPRVQDEMLKPINRNEVTG